MYSLTSPFTLSLSKGDQWYDLRVFRFHLYVAQARVAVAPGGRAGVVAAAAVAATTQSAARRCAPTLSSDGAARRRLGRPEPSDEPGRAQACVDRRGRCLRQHLRRRPSVDARVSVALDPQAGTRR